MKLKIMLGALLCILALNHISYTNQQTMLPEESTKKRCTNNNSKHFFTSKLGWFFSKRPSALNKIEEDILLDSAHNAKNGQQFQNNPLEKEENREEIEDFELLSREEQQAALILEASKVNEFSLLRRFIKKGWNVECADKEGYTPLMIAVIHGNYESARVLLDAKVALDRKNIHGRTALHEACKAGQPDCIILLCECGASKRALDRYGNTPFKSAYSVANGDLRFICHKSLGTKPVGKYDAIKMKWIDEAKLY